MRLELKNSFDKFIGRLDRAEERMNELKVKKYIEII